MKIIIQIIIIHIFNINKTKYLKWDIIIKINKIIILIDKKIIIWIDNKIIILFNKKNNIIIIKNNKETIKEIYVD